MFISEGIFKINATKNNKANEIYWLFFKIEFLEIIKRRGKNCD